jgi:CelD/BcsL family acetyltransferase involved in cellulose biosynthesis
LRIVLHREIPESHKSDETRPEVARPENAGNRNLNLREEWNGLLQHMECPEVFYTWEWASALQSAYGDTLKPLLVLGYEQERLIGIASLVSDSVNKRVGFLAANTADYCEFLSSPEIREEFISAVLVELKKLNLTSMAFANLPVDSATPAALHNAAAKHGLHVYMRPAYSCAQIDLGLSNQKMELRAGLHRKKKLRRYFKELERDGPVSVVHLQSPKEIQQELPAFAAAHAARFRATGRVSSLSTPERRLFLQELANRFAEKHVVTLSILKVAGRAIAWNYGFQFQGSWFWYQPTFDDDYEKNSPGYCLLSQIVMDACSMDGMKFIDLGLGDESYKERFANSARQTLYATVSKSRLQHLQEISRYRAASLLRKSPVIESAVRTVLGR